MKVTRIPEYGESFLEESGTLSFGIRNSALGTQNPANDWNPGSEFHLKSIRNQVQYGIHSLLASSPGRFGGGAQKRKESLRLEIWNLNICIEKVDEKG